jgi:DNA-binding NtrC family response regulator
MTTAETHRIRILVVDDEPLVAGLIAEVLAREGHEVDMARNGREALEKIAARTYDLILSDLRMPELDGVGLFRELERGHPAFLGRLVFVSGTTDAYASFLEETKAPVLPKPFQLEDLQRFVRRILFDP